MTDKSDADEEIAPIVEELEGWMREIVRDEFDKLVDEQRRDIASSRQR